jgi:hypothetical protein
MFILPCLLEILVSLYHAKAAAPPYPIRAGKNTISLDKIPYFKQLRKIARSIFRKSNSRRAYAHRRLPRYAKTAQDNPRAVVVPDQNRKADGKT